MISPGALVILDTVTAAAVEAPPLNEPPASPLPGGCYIVGPAPTGAWSGYAQHLAANTPAGWRFVAPTPGLAALIKSDGSHAICTAGGWESGTVRCEKLVIGGKKVVGQQQPAIAPPSGGATVDSEARSVLNQLLSALSLHGLLASS
jgi:hypothetical protein